MVATVVVCMLGMFIGSIGGSNPFERLVVYLLFVIAAYVSIRKGLEE